MYKRDRQRRSLPDCAIIHIAILHIAIYFMFNVLIVLICRLASIKVFKWTLGIFMSLLVAVLLLHILERKEKLL